MTNYKANITKQDGTFYALVVRIDAGETYQHVCHGYKGRFFKTEKAAIKSTSAFIAKLDA